MSYARHLPKKGGQFVLCLGLEVTLVCCFLAIHFAVRVSISGAGKLVCWVLKEVDLFLLAIFFFFFFFALPLLSVSELHLGLLAGGLGGLVGRLGIVVILH